MWDLCDADTRREGSPVRRSARLGSPPTVEDSDGQKDEGTPHWMGRTRGQAAQRALRVAVPVTAHSCRCQLATRAWAFMWPGGFTPISRKIVGATLLRGTRSVVASRLRLGRRIHRTPSGW